MTITGTPNEHGIYALESICLDELQYDAVGKIALVDADLLDNGTRHPNLAIMKMSGYFKEQGCEVRLVENYNELYEEKTVDTSTAEGCFDNNDAYSLFACKKVKDFCRADEFDAIYVSKVFDFTKIDPELITRPNVVVGGTGFFFDHAPKLPHEIEHHMPDYHIYDSFIEHDTRHQKKEVYYKDYLNYSIGFATRGCFRQCDFCVNHNVKKVEAWSSISEWYDPSRKAIYLWDDNIFGFAHWKTVFDELKATGKPFQFRQGMDIRLMTEDKARALNEAKYHGDIIFALDHIEDCDLVSKKLELWTSISKKSTKLYVLAGFASQDEVEIESVFQRIAVCIKYGAFPYIMRHEYYLKSPYREMFVTLARWCNQPQFMRNYSFREFCEANQKYHRNKDTLCASLAAMRDFEAKFPEIAERYFDMKYNEQPYVIARKEARKAADAQKKAEKEAKAAETALKKAASQKKRSKTAENIPYIHEDIHDYGDLESDVSENG